MGALGSSLPCLSERPFRTLPGGSLRKFLRGLSQFPLSFPTESRWVPPSSGEVRSEPWHTLVGDNSHQV